MEWSKTFVWRKWKWICAEFSLRNPIYSLFPGYFFLLQPKKNIERMCWKDVVNKAKETIFRPSLVSVEVEKMLQVDTMHWCIAYALACVQKSVTFIVNESKPIELCCVRLVNRSNHSDSRAAFRNIKNHHICGHCEFRAGQAPFHHRWTEAHANKAYATYAQRNRVADTVRQRDPFSDGQRRDRIVVFLGESQRKTIRFLAEVL